MAYGLTILTSGSPGVPLRIRPQPERENERYDDRRRQEPAAMKPPLKLNAIDQEHLQELYNASGVARDELPYTPVFEQLVQGFQDRTFKNADAEQVFAALLKYTRSSSN